MLREVWPFLVAKRAAGHAVTVARLVDRVGPGSRPVGAMMAVASDGSWCGSISGGCVEGLLLAQAEEVLNGAAPRIAVVRPGEDRMPWEVSGACTGELHVLVTPAPDAAVTAVIDRAMMENQRVRVRTSLTDPYAWAVGPAAGPGQEREFVEDVEPQPVLLIVGATDLAADLAAIAVAVGRRVVVVDPRHDFAKPERVPAALVVQAWPDGWLRDNPLTPRDAALVVTHDVKIDDRALEALLPGAAGYVGVLGSRATQAERVARLSRVTGIERLAGPAGLDLGGRSNAETALSMVAEIVAAAHDRSGGRLRDGTGPVQEQ